MGSNRFRTQNRGDHVHFADIGPTAQILNIGQGSSRLFFSLRALPRRASVALVSSRLAGRPWPTLLKKNMKGPAHFAGVGPAAKIRNIREHALQSFAPEKIGLLSVLRARSAYVSIHSTQRPAPELVHKRSRNYYNQGGAVHGYAGAIIASLRERRPPSIRCANCDLRGWKPRVLRGRRAPFAHVPSLLAGRP